MLKRGMVVISSRGRDAGGYMVISDVEEARVWIADGKRRPLARPKQKNPRHLRHTGHEISEASMATNRELRKALKEISVRITEGG